ncbi:MAG: hypothetical protein JJE47_10470 [Acidimicrobiia bacterium]|nr:hypothetical protein [Acidimicrobiia bacterium]
MRRILVLVFLLGTLAVPAFAQTSDGAIDVVEVQGPVDQFLVRFVTDSIESAAARDSEFVILKIDSPGSLTTEVEELIALVQNPPLPVVAWIGDAPATAQGASLRLAEAAQITIAAPGVEIGRRFRMIIGEPAASSDDDVLVTVTEPIPGAIDDIQAALGPLIVSLDGKTVELADRTVTLHTAEQVTEGDGQVRSQVTKQVRFNELGVWARTMRLAITPEAAFFFLVVGLAFAAFEFYAIGPGLAAATAVVPILLAGYGLSAMPFGWGLPVTLFAMWLLTVDYQRGGFSVLSYIGTVLLGVGGLFIAGTYPDMAPSVGAVVVTTLGVALFYMFAMSTVARSRFTTQTMGRDHLIGAMGVALTDVTGEGLVEIEGARWRATSHREAGISQGSPVVVASVQGMFLEVELPDREKQT